MNEDANANKVKFKEKTGYEGEFTPEEDTLLKHLSDEELDCLVKLRGKEREVAGREQTNSPAYTPVIPYAVGPKAY